MKDKEARKIIKVICEKLNLALSEDEKGVLSVKEVTYEELKKIVQKQLVDFLNQKQ